MVGPEEYRIPLAIERYQKEILRVFGVLESVLSKQEWLVGGKYTIADLSFVILILDSVGVDIRTAKREPEVTSLSMWRWALVELSNCVRRYYRHVVLVLRSVF